MMTDRICLHCRSPADPNHRFCGRCGTALHERCAVCDAAVPPDLAFCTGCGGKRSAPADPPVAVREERRTITVLFLDLVELTELADRLDPEDLRRLQVAYFATATEVVCRYGGILEKYVGDAVVAVFGVPVQSEHDALRAVRAGLDLRRVLSERPLAGRYPVRARVGIATGEALVDLVAAHNAGEAMASGDVVATAARLLQHAPDGGVLVSAATRRCTVGLIHYGAVPCRVAIAGRAGPVDAWIARGVAGRAQIGADDDVPLMGRSHELELVVAALTRCVNDRETRLLCVVGAHGVGKSRLVREVGRQLDAAPDVVVRWRTGRCLPYGESGPYAALSEIIKYQADVLDTDDQATRRARLTTALADLVPRGDVGRLADLLGPLLGLPGRPVSAGEIEAAWADVLIALARQMPTILVIDDLHYADPALLRFLTRLLEMITDVPLLILCAYRPELLDDQPALAGGRPGTLTVSLGPLRGRILNAFVVTSLRRHGLPESLTDPLTTITGGNPLYVAEYVRMLAERATTGELDPDTDLTMPDTVHGVVANRIDLLDATERTVLHAAAVLGETVWPGALRAMVRLTDDAVHRGLRGLRARDMLVVGDAPLAGSDTSELVFRHRLVRDVAYGRLPRAARAELHRSAAGWLEEQSAAGRRDLAAAVAGHRTAALALATSLGVDTAADAEAVRRALWDASSAAFDVYAAAPALAYLEQSLTHWPAELEPVERLSAELQRRRLEFLVDSDSFYREGGAKDLQRIAARMRYLGDCYGAARAETLLGQAEYMRAELERAGEHLGRAIALFAELPPSAAKAEAYGELARLHVMRYRPAEAVAAAGTARRLAEEFGLANAAASACVTEATARYLDGDVTGLRQLHDTVELCRARRLPELRRAANNLSALLLQEGDLAGSAAAGAESAAAHGMQVSLVLGYSAEAERAYFTGDWTGLLAAADAYFAADDAETTEWDMQLRARRAWIRVLRDEPPGTDIERCLSTARRSGLDRLLFNATAHGALYYAIEGCDLHAAALLGELIRVWRERPTVITVEWLSAVVHTAALVPGTAAIATEITATVPNRTRWIMAAEAVAAGAQAAAHGDHEAAAREWTAATARYEAIGGLSDAALSATWTARALGAGGRHPAAAPVLDRVRDFAVRNGAPGLLRCADPAQVPLRAAGPPA